MKTALIIIAGLILLIVIILSFSKKKNKSDSTSVALVETKIPTITGQQVVDTLAALGYFKYTDADKLDTLKHEIATTYDDVKVLTTINEYKPPHEPYCRRFYFCDGETLFELGGVVDYLKDIKPTFDKLNIPLEWKDDYFSKDGTEHTIIINGKKYTAYKGAADDLRAWGIATKNFVEILNDQLAIHKSDERVYPILFNNDGRIIFLTKPQYDFIFEHFDERERPMEVNHWWKTFNK
jgi:hypothetical protein